MKTPKPDKSLAAQQAQELAAQQAKSEQLQSEKNAKQRALLSRNMGRLSLFSGSELGVDNGNKSTTLG